MFDLPVNDVRPPDRYAGPVETMGERIKTLREARGLTQEQLGKAVGVTKGAVSAWETGNAQNVRLVTFLKLLDVLRTDYEYLVYGAGRAPHSAQPSLPLRRTLKSS